MSRIVEVRAVVRLEMLDRVVRRLKDSGVPRLTVTRVHAIGAGADSATSRFSFQEGSAYSDKASVCFICDAERSDMFCELVAESARTGRRGDGIVAVYPVDTVVKIRTGATGVAALA